MEDDTRTARPCVVQAARSAQVGRTVHESPTRLMLMLVVAAAGPAMTSSVPARATRGMVVAEHAGLGHRRRCFAKAERRRCRRRHGVRAAVVHPTAEHRGGGSAVPAEGGRPVAYDFREMAPSGSGPTMFMKDGSVPPRHHEGYLSVGVPGTVAGLHLA